MTSRLYRVIDDEEHKAVLSQSHQTIFTRLQHIVSTSESNVRAAPPRTFSTQLDVWRMHPSLQDKEGTEKEKDDKSVTTTSVRKKSTFISICGPVEPQQQTDKKRVILVDREHRKVMETNEEFVTLMSQRLIQVRKATDTTWNKGNAVKHVIKYIGMTYEVGDFKISIGKCQWKSKVVGIAMEIILDSVQNIVVAKPAIDKFCHTLSLSLTSIGLRLIEIPGMYKDYDLSDNASSMHRGLQYAEMAAIFSQNENVKT